MNNITYDYIEIVVFNVSFYGAITLHLNRCKFCNSSRW